ncbi:MAG: hypothetical protein HY360_19975 [Verrucomicrobia bacterium]|nr:hypothetical protein [Verrucomicrobiota bacterium]
MKTPGNIFLTGILILLPLICAAEKGEVIVFNRDFEKDRNLEGWLDVFGKDISASHSGPSRYCVVKEDGNHFFRCTKQSGIFGVTAPLKPALTIGDEITTVELRAKVRRSAAGGLLQMALTSRRQPEGQQGGPFHCSGAPADSGFRVCGYESANDANLLEWRVEGLSHAHTERKPFLTGVRGEWHEWRVVLDQAAGTLTLYTEEAGQDPVLVQKGVALDGVELRSLWLSGSGGAPSRPEENFMDYDDLVVAYTRAPKGK